MSHKYLNLVQDGEEGGGLGPPPPPVTSTNVRISPKNVLAFSFDPFDPFATLV